MNIYHLKKSSRLIVSCLVLLTCFVLYSEHFQLSADAYTESTGVIVSLNVGTGTATTTPTTTPPIIPTSTPPDSGDGKLPRKSPKRNEFWIKTLSRDITSHSISYSFQTSHKAQATLKWGLNDDYELGSSAHIDYSYNHQLIIENLPAGKDIFIEIIFKTADGKEYVMHSVVRTRIISELNDTIPTNVSEVSAVRRGEDVIITWKLPPELDGVRITRSYGEVLFDPYEGYVVYEGSRTHALDAKCGLNDTCVYTLFGKKGGLFSSGVFVTVYPLGTMSTRNDLIFENADDTPIDLSLKSITADVTQNGYQALLIDGRWTVDAFEPFTIFIKEKYLPQINASKNVIATIVFDNEIGYQYGQSISSLMFFETSKNTFSSRFGALGREGEATVFINTLDANGELVLIGVFKMDSVRSNMGDEWQQIQSFDIIIWLFWIIFLFTFLLFIIRRFIVK